MQALSSVLAAEWRSDSLAGITAAFPQAKPGLPLCPGALASAVCLLTPHQGRSAVTCGDRLLWVMATSCLDYSSGGLVQLRPLSASMACSSQPAASTLSLSQPESA